MYIYIYIYIYTYLELYYPYFLSILTRWIGHPQTAKGSELRKFALSGSCVHVQRHALFYVIPCFKATPFHSITLLPILVYL